MEEEMTMREQKIWKTEKKKDREESIQKIRNRERGWQRDWRVVQTASTDRSVNLSAWTYMAFWHTFH